MITFSYQARDASGKIVSGIQDALNEDNAVTSLMSRGLMVLSLQKKSVASRSRKKSWSVKETDLVLFTRQLATMIEAGISLVQGLTALYEQCDPKRQRSLRHVVSDITTRVQGGETFHESIAKHPRVFNRLFVSMVKAGESGGLLAEILERLAGFLEASARLRKKVKSAMTYPVIVVCIAFAITTFLIVRVVPIFGEIFADFGAKLPAPTQFLIDVSNFVRGEWYFLVAGIGGAIFAVPFSQKSISPPMLLRMVAAGEATGKIDTMLEKMADFWDEEIEAMLDALTSLIEPMLIVFLGVIVGGIVIAMFLPIFKLNEVVSQNKSN